MLRTNYAGNLLLSILWVRSHRGNLEMKYQRSPS
jgi:hypothetical protein